MDRDRRGVLVVTAAALALLLPACATPSKPEGRVQTWSYVETRLPPYWWAALVDISGARGRGATGTGRRIAILDTGVLPGQEDLANVSPGTTTCGASSADTDTTDTNGHGTQLAGIAAGKDPGRATRGVAPAARLIPIKVSCGLVTADALTKGLDRAIAEKPDVVLLALGGYPAGPPDVSAFLKDRIGKNPDVLFVVASVWDGTVYPLPEWTRLDNALVVAAMTLDNARNEVLFSNRAGDVWAPGRDIETADILPDPANPSLHTPYMMQGTSAASAIVAGCAALVKERTGQTGARLKATLVQTAEPKPGLGALNNRRLSCGKAVP
jgi:subtilisin family serine protease